MRWFAISKGMQTVKLCSNKILVLNWWCRLMQADLYNACKMVAVVVIFNSNSELTGTVGQQICKQCTCNWLYLQQQVTQSRYQQFLITTIIISFC